MPRRQLAHLQTEDFEHAPISLPDYDAPRLSAVSADESAAEPAEPRSRASLIVLATTGLLLTVLAGWGVDTLLDPHTLPLKTVRIEGSFKHTTTAALQRSVTPAVAGNIVSVDMSAIRRAAQTLPWVQTVSVQRVWPDTLRIMVVEHVAVARWKDQALLNSHGEVFMPDPASYPTGLPELHGPEATAPTVLTYYHTLNKLLTPLNLHIRRLEMTERRAWRLELNNGLEILLGRTDAYARLLRFVQAYPQVSSIQATAMARVDMRYSNGLAVRSKKPAGEPQLLTRGENDNVKKD